MKKQEVETVINELKEVKTITDREKYLVSSAVNQHLNTAFEVLSKELERLDKNGVEINCPKIMLFKNDVTSEHLDKEDTLTFLINKQIEDLVKQDFKIIDYGLYNNETAYIKYTD